MLMNLTIFLPNYCHKISPNKLLKLYNDTDRKAMVAAVDDLYRSSMARRFAAQKTEAKTIFIDPSLYNIPISVGDRSTTIQDTSCALMGTHFPVEGDAVNRARSEGEDTGSVLVCINLNGNGSLRSSLDGEVIVL